MTRQEEFVHSIILEEESAASKMSELEDVRKISLEKLSISRCNSSFT